MMNMLVNLLKHLLSKKNAVFTHPRVEHHDSHGAEDLPLTIIRTEMTEN
jgi:hypothetical protein